MTSVPSLGALTRAAFLLALGAVLAPTAIQAQSLRGSSASLDLQNAAARMHDFTFINTGTGVTRFVEQGRLVRVKPTSDLHLNAVSYPYARKEAALFLARLAPQYRAACGEQLVVTSLTRPADRQPRNASDRSVHPTGMAVDLRYSRNRACREWLESVLLDLESDGVVEATREQYPPHYHVAVFPRQYAAFVASAGARAATQVAAMTDDAASFDRAAYQVRSGDSLWTIARRHGTTVDQLLELNRLQGSRIFAGQVIDVPAERMASH